MKFVSQGGTVAPGTIWQFPSSSTLRSPSRSTVIGASCADTARRVALELKVVAAHANLVVLLLEVDLQGGASGRGSEESRALNEGRIRARRRARAENAPWRSPS